ncbi:hypothetical protein GIB67_029630 [Kingdonia uniflora]|uniref:Uncharacterized protein n=1 Tax=Kingdonia uniflora TaxID=39325 RepID=A0A7J7LLB3_9MAGN|nr:hypothetical protein GIB67_029630 [Kingdonia uniflora]
MHYNRAAFDLEIMKHSYQHRQHQSKKNEEISVEVQKPLIPEHDDPAAPTQSVLQFNKQQQSDQECENLNKIELGRFVKREAVIDEEYWYLKDKILDCRYTESYKGNLKIRIENKGKEIYQPHHLLEDIKAISKNDRKRLMKGVFGDIIRSTQVRSSDLFDVNGCWSGSATILPGDKPAMLYTGLDTQNCQVQNLAIPKNLSDPKDRNKNEKPMSSSNSHNSDESGKGVIYFAFPMSFNKLEAEMFQARNYRILQNSSTLIPIHHRRDQALVEHLQLHYQQLGFVMETKQMMVKKPCCALSADLLNLIIQFIEMKKIKGSAMAFFIKVGIMLKQSVINHTSSSPSLFQAIRFMSSSKLFIGGHSYGTDDGTLRDAFATHGEVLEGMIGISTLIFSLKFFFLSSFRAAPFPTPTPDFNGYKGARDIIKDDTVTIHN